MIGAQTTVINEISETFSAEISMCAVVALARRTVAAVLHQWKLWNFSAHPRFGQVSLHASIIISTASQRQTLGPTDRQLLETLFGG